MMGWIVRFLVLGIGATLRWRIEDPAAMLGNLPNRPVIFAVWHNRLFMVPYLLQRYWPRKKVAVMVSASRDGEKLVRVLEKFGLTCVRGSSSRRGKAALLEMTSYVNAGYDAGITPDGPRGPKYQVAHGVISLAQVTGAPILPASWDVTWKVTLNSWDRFIIPLPFARATLRIGPLLTIEREATDARREEKKLELQTVLNTLSDS